MTKIIPFDLPEPEVGANNEPVILTETQESIAKLAAQGDIPSMIARKMNIDPRVVVETLEIPEIKKYRDNLLDIMVTEVDVKRLNAAYEMLPKIIEGVNTILETDATKWKMKDVKLFELFLKEINKKEKEVASKQPLMNFNINTQSNGSFEKSLDEKVSILPAGKMMEFWTEVEAMAERYVKEYVEEEQVQTIQNVIGPNDGSSVV